MRPNGIVMIASSEFATPAKAKNPGRGLQIRSPVETNPGSSRMRLGPTNDGSLLPRTARARTIETSPATTSTRLSVHSAHRLAHSPLRSPLNPPLLERVFCRRSAPLYRLPPNESHTVNSMWRHNSSAVALGRDVVPRGAGSNEPSQPGILRVACTGRIVLRRLTPFIGSGRGAVLDRC